MKQFAGLDFATEKGFTIHHHSGTGDYVCYVNDEGIFLDIVKNSEGKLHGKLSFMHKLITITTMDFSIPHANFNMFYNQILFVYDRLGD